MRGLLFDIKEMAVFDGPGIRTTVFLKGCPLHCTWCHNPEGISPYPQLMVSIASCINCGSCSEVCPTDADPAKCTACGKCIPFCPLHLRKIAGDSWEASELAAELLRNRSILESNGGGITFSGGEPLMQHEFVLEVVKKLEGLHCAIETSGYSSPLVFKKMIKAMNYVIMDLKVIDSYVHRAYCGKENGIILKNLEFLKESGIPFRIRIPIIPGVNDTYENYAATAELLENVAGLEMVELLPYHKTAGAKYEMLHLSYRPGFDVEKKPHLDTEVFLAKGIPCSIA